MNKKQQFELDATDQKILTVLEGNARLSYRQVAKKIGVSGATAVKRVQRLEKEEVITGYHALIDYEKLGYDLDVFINVKIAQGKFDAFEKAIAREPGVVSVYDITGDFDAVVVARFKSRKSLDLFLKKMQHLAFVERSDTHLIIRKVKAGAL